MADVNSGDILSLCKRRGFIYPSYEIYGGIAGLFDYGPLGCTMKTNVMNQWRRNYSTVWFICNIAAKTRPA